MEGFRRWRGPFWLHRDITTFICHAAYQNTAVIQEGVNTLPPNFNTLSVMYLHVLQLFKEFTARRF
jgi:hypothetical protein